VQLPDPMPTVLVTGANRGIGLEICRQLQARGERVIAVCRTASAELAALGVRVEAGVELLLASWDRLAGTATSRSDQASCSSAIPRR